MSQTTPLKEIDLSGNVFAYQGEHIRMVIELVEPENRPVGNRTISVFSVLSNAHRLGSLVLVVGLCILVIYVLWIRPYHTGSE